MLEARTMGVGKHSPSKALNASRRDVGQSWASLANSARL
jgi:hypothetical protein